MPEPRATRPGEVTFAVILLGLSLAIAWQAWEISGFSALSSPGAVPMAAAGLMVLAALVVLVDTLRRRPRRARATMARAFRAEVTPAVVVVFAGFVLGYAALLDTLGFLPASLLFLFAAIQFLWRAHPGLTFAVSLGALIVIYAVFRLVFAVVLPEGIVPEREIMAWIEDLFTASGGTE